jgi:uncharacterized membrane protein YbhN (UPF0104 family)
VADSRPKVRARFTALAIARWCVAHLPFRSTIRELDDTLRLAVREWRLSAKAVALSFVSQGIVISATYGLAAVLGIRGVSLYQFFIFDPIIFVITAVPTSLGSLGVQEYAYVKLFGLVGVPENEAVALSLLFRLSNILVSIPGGVIFGLGLARKSVHAEGRTDPQVG